MNLANSNFNLYVLYIKLAQNTKQFKRLVLANFITAIHFLFGRTGILWAYALSFWAAEHLTPLCRQVTSIQCVKCGNTHTGKNIIQCVKCGNTHTGKNLIQCVKCGNTHTGKNFCWHTRGWGMLFLK